MHEESMKKYKAVSALIRQGESQIKALRTHKMGAATFYKCRRDAATVPSKPAPAKYVDLAPIRTGSGRVAVIVCAPEQLANILAGLQ